MSTGWIQTFTGRQFFPLAPRPQDVDLRDIAHALSLKCRFSGHCRLFYSVADHSLRVSRLLQSAPPVIPAAPPSPTPPNLRTLALWGLMHDAAEAYLADISAPIKHAFHIHHAGRTQPFDALEERLLAVIAAALNFPPIDYALVRHADHTLLVTEARDLLAPPPQPWPFPQTPLSEPIHPLDPPAAEAAFLARFAQLLP